MAGYYDPRDGRLRVVTGAGTGTRVLKEMALAHELTHALEDQRFGIPDSTRAATTARWRSTALMEGTATALMYAYVLRNFSSEETLGSLLGAAFQDTGDLPPFLEAQVVFPYVGGEAFIEELLRRAGGRWDLVNTAYEVRLPSSTEQILHPAAYFDADEPKPVRIRAGTVLGRAGRAPPPAPGESCRRASWSRLDGARGGRAGAGTGTSCGSPARRGALLVMRWRWDTPRDADRVRAAARGSSGEQSLRQAGHAVVDRRRNGDAGGRARPACRATGGGGS